MARNNKINKNGNSNRTNAYEDFSKQERGTKKMGKDIMTSKKRPCWSAKGDHNDPSWYKDSQGVVSDSLRISTFLPAGGSFFKGDLFDGRNVSEVREGIPTVMAIDWFPTPFASENGVSGVSIAANNLFQQVRKVLNKPIANYSFTDPVIAYVCFMSIMGYVEEIKRDYGIMNTYSTYNLAYPRGVLHALGYNDDAINDLRSHMADYRVKFNTIMYQLSSIFMPIETNIGEKYKWMARNMFLDHSNAKAQIYVYRMAGMYTWEETGEQGSTAKFAELKWNDMYTENKLFQTKLNILEALITQLRDSDSFNYLMSDLLRAFPDAQSYTWETLADDYMIQPSTNDMMLNQLQNIVTVPGEVPSADSQYTLDITQDVLKNTIVTNIAFDVGTKNDTNATTTIRRWDEDGMGSNFIGLNVSEDSIIENMVVKPVFESEPVKYNNHYYYRLRQDSFVGCLYYKFRIFYPLADPSAAKPADWSHVTFNSYVDTYGDTQLTILRNLTHFDWHPLVWPIFSWMPDGATAPILESHEIPFGEVDNYVLVPKANMMNAFRAMQFALWRVPEDVKQGRIQ